MLCISVITPTYNRAEKMRTAITSVLQQSFRNWELLVVDDGSTDHTQDVVSDIQKKNPSCDISYVRQDNAGPSEARNKGTMQASGDIIAYLDSDDTLYPSALEDIAWIMRDENVLYGLTGHNRTMCLVD